MLDRAMEWARRTFDTAIVTAPDGSVHDRYAVIVPEIRGGATVMDDVFNEDYEAQAE